MRRLYSHPFLAVPRESAFIVSGLGYNPSTKHYDASRNVRIRSIELAPNFKVGLFERSSLAPF